MCGYGSYYGGYSKCNCKEKCDCCCVNGIKDQLREDSVVVILVGERAFAGTVTAVDCDIVRLGAPPAGTTSPIPGTINITTSGRFSLCEIRGVFVITR